MEMSLVLEKKGEYKYFTKITHVCCPDPEKKTLETIDCFVLNSIFFCTTLYLISVAM